MGIFVSCCKGEDVVDPTKLNESLETRRQLQAEAAEKRIQEQQNRGIKDPEKVRRQQLKAAEMEKRADLGELDTPTLKWTAN